MLEMQLLLMRHGEAGPAAGTDFDRTLTARGRNDVLAVARVVQREGYAIEKILASPYRRTQETAALVMQVLGEPPLGVYTEERITPDTDPMDSVAALTAGFDKLAAGIVVTHQPLISRLIHLLTGKEVGMRPGNLAVLDAPLIAPGYCSLICIH